MRVHQQVLGGNGRFVDVGFDERPNVVLGAHTGAAKGHPDFARSGNGHRSRDCQGLNRFFGDGIQSDVFSCCGDRRVSDVSLNGGSIVDRSRQNQFPEVAIAKVLTAQIAFTNQLPVIGVGLIVLGIHT